MIPEDGQLQPRTQALSEARSGKSLGTRLGQLNQETYMHEFHMFRNGG
jgi:hypothetical protein